MQNFDQNFDKIFQTIILIKTYFAMFSINPISLISEMI